MREDSIIGAYSSGPGDCQSDARRRGFGERPFAGIFAPVPMVGLWGEFAMRWVGAEDSSVTVGGEVDYQSPGAAPRRLTTFSLDSRQLPREPIVSASARHGADVNSAAVRIGHAIARAVIELARRNNWPGAAR